MSSLIKTLNTMYGSTEHSSNAYVMSTERFLKLALALTKALELKNVRVKCVNN